MAGEVLDYEGLAHFKEKLDQQNESQYAKKDEAVTKEEASSFAGYANYGAARDRDTSKPTYGLT